MQGKELINLVLGNISNSLVNMKIDSSEESIKTEKNIIHETIKNYIMYLNGNKVNLFNYKAETDDYEIENTLNKIRISLLFIDAAHYVDISLYRDLITDQYTKILDVVDEYIEKLNKKKTR